MPASKYSISSTDIIMIKEEHKAAKNLERRTFHLLTGLERRTFKVGGVHSPDTISAVSMATIIHTRIIEHKLKKIWSVVYDVKSLPYSGLILLSNRYFCFKSSLPIIRLGCSR